MDRGSQLDEEEEDEEEKEKEKEDEEEERKATDIKSNNPHLAGGEKYGKRKTERKLGKSIEHLEKMGKLTVSHGK